MIDSISMAASHRVWGVQFGLLVRCKSIHTINGAYDALVLFVFLLQDMCRGNYLSTLVHYIVGFNINNQQRATQLSSSDD